MLPEQVKWVQNKFIWLPVAEAMIYRELLSKPSNFYESKKEKEYTYSWKGKNYTEKEFKDFIKNDAGTTTIK